MTDFIREKPGNDIFEGTLQEIVEITLKFKEEFSSTYEKNKENTFSFYQVQKMISSEPRLSYFQKQKNDDNGYGSRHKIIIPLDEEKALEAKVSLSHVKLDAVTEVYSYNVVKFKEISLFNEPKKNTIKRLCMYKIATMQQRIGTDSNNFRELYRQIEALDIPVVDLNKDKDRKIWKTYVVALKKIVRQKEQIWKIQNISQPYSDKDSANIERNNFIDIYINEKDLERQFEKAIESTFKDEELADYGAQEDKAFIEFNSFRELSQEELNKLTEIAGEYFYDLSYSSPTHYLPGVIEFKYSDTVSKEEILTDIKNILYNDYQINLNVENTGTTDLCENDFPHLQKVVKEKYDYLIDIVRDNKISLDINFPPNGDLQKVIPLVKNKLNENGLTKAKVYIEGQSYFVLELGSHVHSDLLSEFNLVLEKTVSRFGNYKQEPLSEIDGLTIKDNQYLVANTPNWKCQVILNDIRIRNSDISFRWLPTLYYFRINPKSEIERLKTFKTDTDLIGKTIFDIATSKITITAENQSDYQAQLQRIRSIYPKVSIEDKPYTPSFKIQFKTDLELQRKSIINKIQSTISRNISSKVEYEVIKNHTRILFRYYFINEEDRDASRKAIERACELYLNVLDFSFENNLGRTLYEFLKNEKLIEELEKETKKNIFHATFVYLSPQQKKNLDEVISRQGELATFVGGIQIGKLIRKERNKLKFLINENFDQSINAPIDKRLEYKDLIEGYIKPIFPGDITNIDRMIRAMEKVVNPGESSQYFFNKAGLPRRTGFPANRNLSNFLFDPGEARVYDEDIEDEITKILSNLNEPKLKNQRRQLESVAKALLSKDLSLIQGPPGTGKTTVIAEIIWQFLLRDPKAKILVTSQTNLAVDNALERLKGKKLVRPIRIGNSEKFEDEGKVYSYERYQSWLQAKSKSKEEEVNSNNAIFNWINSIQTRDKEDRFAGAIKKWTKGLEECNQWVKQKFSASYFQNINVFAATCSECGSRNFAETYQSIFQMNSELFAEPEFDVVIMDEASKATPPELVLPLTLGKKVVIIGDHKQLPPMIDEKEFGEALDQVGAKQLVEDWTTNDYKISQFEKLFKNAPEKIVASLDTQFRMHKQIMDCISQFYKDQVELKGGLKCGIEAEMNIPDFAVSASRWHGLRSEPFIEPMHHAIWVNVESEERKIGTSYENEGEVKAIMTVLKVLKASEGYQEYNSFFTKPEDKEIGIITYYMPQMQRIRNALYSHFSKIDWKTFEQHKYENEFQIPFRINTVDRFQGMERNIIIVSTVRSNKQIREENGKDVVFNNIKYPFSLGFARELQRINVGFSRAKRLLIVIGNEKHFIHKAEYRDAIQTMHRVDILQLQNLIEK